jgi:hypothetical protein
MIATDQAFYTRLSGGTALTALLAAGTASIFHLQAPEGAALPYVLWSLQGGGDENLSAHRVKQDIYFVRAYSGVSAAQAGAIDAQIDPLLHLVPLTVSGWTDLWLARETDLESVEITPTGARVWMQGGLYRQITEKN